MKRRMNPRARQARALAPALIAALMLSPVMQLTGRAADGNLDTGFGTGGYAVFGLSLSVPASEIIPQPDGKVVVGASTAANTDRRDFLVARLNADGTRDASFGVDGLVVTDFGGGERAFAAALQGDGKIVQVGSTIGLGTLDFALVRYNTDGSLDPTFGTGGRVVTDLRHTADEIRDVAIQPDGKIVVAGILFPPDGSGNTDFVIARYLANGSLDSAFGDEGMVTADFDGLRDTPESVALQSDGRIVVGGNAAPPDAAFDESIALVRFNSDGSLDTSFGDSGQVLTPSPDSVETMRDMVIQPDGQIVVAGLTGASVTAENTQALVVRYTAGGALDPTFGTEGRVTADFRADKIDAANSVTLQADGKIVIAGRTWLSRDTSVVARFRSDGTLDPTFGDDGRVITDRSYISLPNEARGVAIQGDGKIVTAGLLVTPTGSDDVVMTRYEAPALTPHSLAFFLHGRDVPGTLGGFTMNAVPPPFQVLTMNGGKSALTWFSEPTLTGVFQAGARVQLSTPCGVGLSLPRTVTLALTAMDGSDEQLLGHATQGATICLGEQTMVLPVTVPLVLSDRRLKLTIASSTGLSVNLGLGGSAALRVTDFVGTP